MKVFASFALIVAILAVALGYCDGGALTLLRMELIFWLQRPYTGPEIVVEIIGVDLNNRANRFLDRWSRPDTFVTIEHGQTERHITQVEGNTYQPRFLWKTKMRFYETMGMRFLVSDANVLRGDDVVGRAFIDSDRIADMMRTGEPGLLSLGENIGIMKIVVTLPPSDLKEKGALPFTSKVKRLDMP
eukprot:CAMPEP_0201948038 /NCGR_PEP_ID=MMETSP0903-20130614/55254_1 /ASSEMBLY_ACC=CAM_ASM_000552 /TAXON_ID=420261 /ORGANISM="Thalassiosira antarctica, Strain CCMP982" /LENGTH=186 /DNA_ID=CAMNT_0048491203 /DNA_START=68 /DNA_END=628 /DNA_ORIENTATION=+